MRTWFVTSHIWMCHDARRARHLWVPTYLDEQRHGMRHESHMNASQLTHEYATSHLWTSHATHVIESRCMWWVKCGCQLLRINNVTECVTCHIWMRHISRVNKPCHTCERVTSHIWMSHVACNGSNMGAYYSGWTTSRNASRLTCECVTSHAWISHVTHVNESRHTYDWVTLHVVGQLRVPTTQDEQRHGMPHVSHVNASHPTRE